jgi:hypothetical protein
MRTTLVSCLSRGAETSDLVESVVDSEEEKKRGATASSGRLGLFIPRLLSRLLTAQRPWRPPRPPPARIRSAFSGRKPLTETHNDRRHAELNGWRKDGMTIQ